MHLGQFFSFDIFYPGVMKIMMMTINCFSYDETSKVCDLAYLTFLEDPDVGQIEKQIMVDFEAPTYIDKICRGGEHCCNRGKLNLCGIGEGDCNTDNDCGGVLMCGKNNA